MRVIRGTRVERDLTGISSLDGTESTPGVHVHLQNAKAAHEAPQMLVNCS